MENLSLREKIISGMCRLCLSSNGTLIDMFSFSSELENQIVDCVKQCTSVHVEKHSELPRTICESCYMQLIKTQNFQRQALKSDNTLRCYLQQLQDGNKQSLPESSVILPDIDGNSSLETNAAKQDMNDNSTNCEEIKPEVKYFERCCEEFEINIVEKKVDPLETRSYKEWDIHSSSKDSTFNPNLTLKAEPLINDNDTEILNDYAVSQKNIILKNVVSLNKMLTSYQCDICNKRFCNTANLRMHQRVHTGEKPYQCNVCNKCFSKSSNLGIHQRVHLGEKPYQCDVCNKSFRQLGHLKTHQRLHTGEKPYQCDVCNICFTNSANLRRHQHVHSVTKPYQCDVCNKCFSHTSNLGIHKRLHTGDKRYQCDICNKRFNESAALRRHQRVHTGEKPYQCDICKKCFSHLNSLNTHKRKHSSNTV